MIGRLAVRRRGSAPGIRRIAPPLTTLRAIVVASALVGGTRLAVAAPAHEPEHARRLIISNVTLVPLEEGESPRRVSIAIAGDRIDAIEEGPETLWRRGDDLIRGDGLWLMPGLIDTRVAASEPAALHGLALDGITTVGIADGAVLAWLAPLAAHAPAALPRLRPALANSTAQQPEPESASLPPSADCDLVDRLLDLERAGASRRRCLRQATREAAEALALPTVGVVRVGAVADLLLLEADPSQDLAALRRIRAVILRGADYRAAQRESTRELLERLREAASAAGGRPAGPDARRWLIRFDGLPRGVQEAEIPTGDPPASAAETRRLWEPLFSDLVIEGQWDEAWAPSAIRLRFASAAGDLELDAFSGPAGWTVRWPEQDGLAGGDLPLGLPGTGPPPLLVLDLWPTAVDLHRVWMDAPVRAPVVQLLVGGGGTSLALAALRAERWDRGADAPPRGWPRAMEALASAALQGPWRPASVVFVWIGVQDGASSSPAMDLILRGWETRTVTAGVVAFDGDGWPVAGRFCVPEGIWEFHGWSECSGTPAVRDAIGPPRP